MVLSPSCTIQNCISIYIDPHLDEVGKNNLIYEEFIINK